MGQTLSVKWWYNWLTQAAVLYCRQKRMDWNLSCQDLMIILGHALRPWTDDTNDRPSLLDTCMFEQLDSVQWNSVGIIPIAHVNY